MAENEPTQEPQADELDEEELERHDGEPLPDREAVSVITPPGGPAVEEI